MTAWRPRLLTHIVVFATAWMAAGSVLQAQKFYPDDPLVAEPPPVPVVGPQPRALSELLELFFNTMTQPGERHPQPGVIEAGGVNTLGEVMDSDWFVNRHATRRLTRDELIRGPGTAHAPDPVGPWRVVTVQPHGAQPGILVTDARDRLYLLVFDPSGYPEMSTGSQMVSSRLAWAIGYFVPECYLVRFDRTVLTITDHSEIVSSAGNRRALTPTDVDVFFRGVARPVGGQVRAVAMYIPEAERYGYLGPYQLFTRRSDDPNDIVSHEHRRDLRGLFVVSAWLDHAWMRAVATADVLITVDGIPRIRHLLTDFRGTLGSGRNEPKQAWDGNGPMLDGDSIVSNAFGFGFRAPSWMRERFPDIPGVGRFAASTFDPELWSPLERLAAFENRLPDDEYWAAKQIAAFSDDDIAAVVSTAEYSDPAAARWISGTLAERRDRIARTYFRKVLPLDDFRIDGGALRFDDLAVRYHVADGPMTYSPLWFRFDNAAASLIPLEGATGFDLPAQVTAAPDESYFAAHITSAERAQGMAVTVYLRTRHGTVSVVGIDRAWPGRIVVDPRALDGDVERFHGLSSAQQHLYEPFAVRDTEARGRTMTVPEHFDSQTISIRTTYDSVTHALQSTVLTDADGHDLGTALDLVTGLDRIAGQYPGRSGDLQFRIFGELRPDAIDVLTRSTQFFRDRDNTVYHVGFPISFRQVGSVPNLQFSISEDGHRTDIDIDYRASGIPRGLFNGHLSASNSDVRAGDNIQRHDRRWEGLPPWWKAVYGTLTEAHDITNGLLPPPDTRPSTPLPPDRPAGAFIDSPADAAQEFLTDWLVRRRLDEAMAAISPRFSACMNVDEDRREEALAGDNARRLLRESMTYVLDRIGTVANLTAAIEALPHTDGGPARVDHTFDHEFSLTRLSPAEAAAVYFRCDAGSAPAPDGEYYATLFRFRREDSAVLGLLWAREDGRWVLRSFASIDN